MSFGTIDAAIIDYIDDRTSSAVYPHYVPQNGTFPCVVVILMSDVNVTTHDGPTDRHDAVFQIHCLAQGNGSIMAAKTLAKTIKAAMNGVRTTLDSYVIQGMFADGDEDTSDISPELQEQGISGVRFDLKVFYRET